MYLFFVVVIQRGRQTDGHGHTYYCA